MLPPNGPPHGAALPSLRLTPNGNGNAMRLTWHADATGYRLQTSETLSNWTFFGSVLTGRHLGRSLNADGPRRYYRPAKP